MGSVLYNLYSFVFEPCVSAGFPKNHPRSRMNTQLRKASRNYCGGGELEADSISLSISASNQRGMAAACVTRWHFCLIIFRIPMKITPHFATLPVFDPPNCSDRLHNYNYRSFPQDCCVRFGSNLFVTYGEISFIVEMFRGQK